MKKVKQLWAKIAFKDDPIANLIFIIMGLLFGCASVLVMLVQFKLIKP
jgi:hypothetical protein